MFSRLEHGSSTVNPTADLGRVHINYSDHPRNIVNFSAKVSDETCEIVTSL